MRVVMLGGGYVGTHAMRTLLRLRPELEVVVADRDGAAAKRLATPYQGASAVAIDVTDREALRSLLRDAQLVVSTVGPYFRFGLGVLRAALDAGCHYLDVCDDWEPTEQMLALDEQARERGLTAVIGLGITPGVSNLLAARAIAELDVAREVVTGWSLHRARPETIRADPSAATIHGIEQLSGTIRLFRDGSFVDERPVQKVWIDYPGLGRRFAWTIGHPEPVTLPRTYPELRRAVNATTVGRLPALAILAAARLIDRGLVRKETVGRWAERIEGPESGELDREALVADVVRGREQLPPIYAWARGERAGAEARVGVTLTAAPPGGMGGATGVPLGLGAAMLLGGEIDRPRLGGPEAAIDPDAFFRSFAPLCVPESSPSGLLLVTRSWQARSYRAAWDAATSPRSSDSSRA